MTMELREGELVGLIGPNGAGKQQYSISYPACMCPPVEKSSLIQGGKTIAVQGKNPHVICKSGIGRTFQNIRLFRDLTVMDNVRIAMHHNVKYGLLSVSCIFLPTGVKKDVLKKRAWSP